MRVLAALRGLARAAGSARASGSAAGAAAGAASGEQAPLQLYIFEQPPRALPPVTDVAGLWGRPLVRAVRRAAGHPWRDAAFWRSAAERVAAGPAADLAGRDLAQLCLAFRRVEFFASPALAAHCELYLAERRQALNTFELAALASYFAPARAGTPGAEEFLRSLADEVCIEWRKSEMVPWSAWRMLVSAAAEGGVPHKELFELAAPHLARSVQFMGGRDVTEICEAYAAFRFRHSELLEEVSRFLPSLGLAPEDVRAIEVAFDRLDFESPMLGSMRELRGYARAPAPGP